MKSTQRHTATAMGILVLSLAGALTHASLLAQGNQPAQRGMPPNPDTPRILVTVFQSTDHQLAVDGANELRHRLQQEHSAKDLYVNPKNDIESALVASGYKADSALAATDLMELAKVLRSDYVIDAKITRNGQMARWDARLLTKTANQTLAQPLPPVDGKDAGDVAKSAEKEIDDALKQMTSYKQCTTDLRAQKYDEAAKDARAGIAAYPNSTLNRLCLLSAFNYAKPQNQDSIIAISDAILALDPTSLIALNLAAAAYAAKGDTNKSIDYSLRIYKADPSNTAVAQSIVQQLANSGAPDKALPIIDSLLVQNPGEPGMLKTKWLLQLRAKQWKNALATGEEYIKSDTTAANLDYFTRQIGAAQSDSNTAAAQALAARAAQKFSKEISFPLLMAQGAYKAGQLQQALDNVHKAQAIDPKNPSAALFEVTIYNQLGHPDSALAAAKRAIAAGVPRDSLAQAVTATLAPALKQAQTSNTRQDWETAFAAAQTVDSIAPTPQTKFYVGVSAFKIATDAVTNVQALYKSQKKDDKAKTCDEANVAEARLNDAAIAMPAGRATDPATANQIMGAAQQYLDFVGQVKKAIKCK